MADNSKSSNTPTLDQQSSLSSIEEKSLASRCSISSTNETKSPIKQRQSTDIKTNIIKKPTITKPK